MDTDENCKALDDTDNSFMKKIKSTLLEKKYSYQFVSLAFAVLAGVCGALACHHLFFPERDIVVVIIKLFRIVLAYCSLIIFCLTDIKCFIIPNKILLFFSAIRVLLIPFEYLFDSKSFWNNIGDCFIGAVICFIILLLISFISRGGIGMGDVKLFTVLTFISGAYCTFNTLLYGLLACALFSIFALLFGNKKAKDKIPFAPFIYIGFVITIILGSF
ncbi:MAG: prepilin peptidase [Lachnospira sp.]